MTNKYPITADLKDLAAEMAGNWQGKDSFAWSDKPDKNPELYMHYYLRNRDSKFFERVFAEVVEEMFENTTDAWVERFRHWGPGWTEELIVKVYEKPRQRQTFDNDSPGVGITYAFRKFFYEVYQPIADDYGGKIYVIGEDEWSARVRERWIELIGEHLVELPTETVYDYIAFEHEDWLNDDEDPYIDKDQVRQAVRELAENELDYPIASAEYIEDLEYALESVSDYLDKAYPMGSVDVGSELHGLILRIEEVMKEIEREKSNL